MDKRTQFMETFWQLRIDSGLPLWIHLIISLQILATCVHTCTFPDYLQSTVNGVANTRDWKGEIRNQNREISLQYRFEVGLMTVESLRPDVPSYSRECVRYLGGSKFLLAHEEEGQVPRKYTCVEFLLRDTAILQIKQAKLSDNLDSTLCDDSNLKLNGWLIIDYNSIKHRREACTLTGGFDMQVYDKSSNQGVCDGYMGETRLESECLPGEGMHFYFRQASCVPDGLLMYPSQRTMCVVNWAVGKYQYTLLSESNMKYLWVLRYPRFVAYGVTLYALLMKDLYATKENTIRKTNNYLSLTLLSQSSKTLDSLCYDDYEICSVLSDPCSYSPDIARTCAKTCGFCTDTNPSTCQFQVQVSGSWVDTRQSDKRPNVNVTASRIEIPGIEKLHCIEWKNSPRIKANGILKSNDGTQYQEQMLVSVSDNGCRPRFTCAKFTKMDQAFFLQLSQTKLWPLVETKHDAYDCSDFQYSTKTLSDDNPYRTNSTNLLMLKNTHPVQCDLSEFEYVSVQFRSRQRCRGRINQNEAKTQMHPEFGVCPIHTIDEEHTCLEYSTFSPSRDKILITKTRYPEYRKLCWLFPEETTDTIYVIESENCHHATFDRIQDGSLIPIATLTKGHTTTTTMTTPKDSSTIIDALTTDSSTDTTIVTNSSNSNDKNSTIDLNGDGSDNTSAMAGATVLISLVLVVAALFCKCKC